MNVEKIDFAILTILQEEHEAILARFTTDPYSDPSSQQTYGISQVQTKDGKNCTVAIARSIRQGNDASQQLANRMINDLDPQMLLVVGIAGGVPDTDFTLGDVIVSSHIHNFDVNAIKGNETTYDVTGGIHPSISNITTSLDLYQRSLAGWNSDASISMPRPHLNLTEKRLKDLLDKNVDEAWREKVEKAFQWHFDGIQRGARAPKFLPGTIASSNTLLRSDAILAHWLQGARNIRVVEMEVAGVYQAAQQIHQQYPVMAIRGVSDIVGFKRDDNWKHYACQTAAAFAYAFITAGIVEPRRNTLSSMDGTDIIEELRSQGGDVDQENQLSTLHLSKESPRSLNQTITPPDAGAKLPSVNVSLPSEPVTPITHSGPIKGIIHKLPRRLVRRSFVISVILLGSMLGYLLYTLLFPGKIMIPNSPVSTPPSQTIPPSVYPSYLPGRGILTLSDSLNHLSNSWEITSNCQFLNEMYHVQASKHEAYTICHQQANEFTNFAFEAQMKIVTGNCGGMVFRSEKSKYKFYRVDICSDGDMRVFLQGDSSLNPLFYKNIADIKQNPNKTHVVAIVAQESILSLYIDQKSIGQIRDDTYTNGQIGLTAYERSNLTDIAYMNVRIWTLKS